jgi:hypothetical protein
VVSGYFVRGSWPFYWTVSRQPVGVVGKTPTADLRPEALCASSLVQQVARSSAAIRKGFLQKTRLMTLAAAGFDFNRCQFTSPLQQKIYLIPGGRSPEKELSVRVL